MNFKKLPVLFLAAIMAISPTAALAETNYNIGADKLTVGTPTAADRKLVFNKGSGTANPAVRWNNTLSRLEYSNDGTNYRAIGSGSGGQGGINLITENTDAEAGVTKWTASGGSFTTTTTSADVGNGAASFVFTPSAGSQTVATDLYAQKGGVTGRACVASILYRTTEATNRYILSAIDGSANVLGTATLDATAGIYRSGYVSFLCPSSAATTVKLQIAAASSTPGAAIYFDDAFLGTDNRLFNLSQASLVWAGNFNGASVATTGGTFSIPGAAGINAPTTLYHSGLGTLDTSDPDSYRLKFSSLPAGVYKVEWACNFTTGVANKNIYARPYEETAASVGSTTSYTEFLTATTLNPNVTIIGTWNLTSAAARSFAIQQSNDDGSTAAGITCLSVRLFRYPTSAEQGMRVDQMSWRVDANITGSNITLGTSNISAYTGIEHGSLTLTNNSGNGIQSAMIPCSSTNAPSGATCSAGNESVGVVYSQPSIGDALACVSFSWNGQLSGTSATASPAFQIVETPSNAQTILQEGKSRVQASTSTSASVSSNYAVMPIRVCGTFSFASAGQKTLRLMYEQTAAGSIAANELLADASVTNGQRDIHWEVYPLSYQSGAFPIFRGTVMSNGSGRYRAEYARVASTCSASPCTIADQSGAWLTSITRASGGSYTANFAAGIFTTAPTCVVSSNALHTSVDSSPTTSAVSFSTAASSHSNADSTFNIHCMGAY